MPDSSLCTDVAGSWQAHTRVGSWLAPKPARREAALPSPGASPPTTSSTCAAGCVDPPLAGRWQARTGVGPGPCRLLAQPEGELPHPPSILLLCLWRAALRLLAVLLHILEGSCHAPTKVVPLPAPGQARRGAAELLPNAAYGKLRWGHWLCWSIPSRQLACPHQVGSRSHPGPSQERSRFTIH